MMFRKESGKVNVTSLVERVSRYTVVMRNEDRRSEPIMEALIAGLAPFPPRPANRLRLTPWHRVFRLATATGWDRGCKLVLRPASAAAERNGREYQQWIQVGTATLM